MKFKSKKTKIRELAFERDMYYNSLKNSDEKIKELAGQIKKLKDKDKKSYKKYKYAILIDNDRTISFWNKGRMENCIKKISFYSDIDNMYSPKIEVEY